MSDSLGAMEDDRLAVFRPVRLRSAADVVLAVLVDAIRGGAFSPGDMLPKERDLAERLGISRPVLRQAFAVLRSAGIVSARRGPGGGTIVESVENLNQVLAHIEGETRFELRQVLEVRRANELYAALLCGERASDADFELLQSLVEDIPNHLGSVQAVIDIDVRFHMTVAEKANNAMLAGIIRDVYNHMSVLREPYPYGHVDYDLGTEHQWLVLNALRSRDPARISEAIDKHNAGFEQVMLGYKLPGYPPLQATER
ncbi:MAG TPA: FCD domain-containing protein [Solirubrobacteraceae bacterium]|jgi:GntR family transcriptional repressor for pyruvate dehydrogenase complex|nr:FCD domain-containing protein [Solirubrobacteraceae bacterium]